MARTHPKHSRITIRANLGAQVFMVFLVLVSMFLTLAVAPTVEPASQRLPVAFVMAALGILPLLLGTVKIRIITDHLQVVNPILIYTVNVQDVAYLDHRNGFQVVLRSGRRIAFAGSAPSLIGSISRYWSARRMIAQIEAATGRTWATTSGWTTDNTPVVRTVRSAAAIWCTAYVVTGVAVASGIAAASR